MDMRGVLTHKYDYTCAAKCVLAPLWCFSDMEVLGWLRESCPGLAGCSVDGSARYLVGELGQGAWARQWTGVASKLVRRTGDVVAAGEALGIGAI